MDNDYAKRTLRDILNELIERTNSIIMRLRIVEQRNKTAMTKMDSLYTSSTEQIKESKKLMNLFEKRMKVYDDRLFNMESGFKNISKKVDNSATRSELKGLKQTIDLYNPVKSQFMTKKEVKEMMEERNNVIKKKEKT